MTELKGYKALLTDRLSELHERLKNVESELDQPSNPDFEDRAIEREGDEVLEGLEAAGLSEIRMINAALDRIASGTYGVCAECGEPISNDRLATIPHAARCRNCA